MKTIDFEVSLSETMSDAAPIELTILGEQIICMTPQTARTLIARLTAATDYAERWAAWRARKDCN